MQMTTPFSIDDPANRVTVQAALDAFLEATSLEEMEEVVDEFPFVVDAQFEEGINRMIEHASRVGEADALLRLQEQLALLHEITRPEVLSPVEEAVEAFLYAEEEADAVAVFEEDPELLRSEQAAQIIFAVEAGDPESHLHLEARRQLWRELVSRT
jgi:cobalamin-dependent methionine synthase I